MLKRTKKWMMAGMMILAMAGFGGSAVGAKGSTEMDPEDLIYCPSDMYWTNNGKKLVVEGAFLNLSEDYDIVGFEEAEIYMMDDSGDIIKTVTVNTDYLKKIPHNGIFEYNFTISSIEGGSEAYGAYDLLPVAGVAFYYEECEGAGCSYCGGSSTSKAPAASKAAEESEICTECGGSGRSEFKCVSCDGTGIDPSYEATRGSVLHGFIDEECSICGGTGYKSCLFCGGTGRN